MKNVQEMGNIKSVNYEHHKMNRIKFVSYWILATGIFIAVIGVIHSGFSPMMYRQMMNDASIQDKAAGFVYFFALGGFAFCFAGLLSAYASFGLRKPEKWAWVIAFSSALFVAIGGGFAISFAKFGNPLIYIMLICSVSNIFLLLIPGKRNKET